MQPPEEGPARVLHVDGDAASLERVRSFLGERGFEVESATDAGEALDRLAAADFDCVVSDYRLPGRDGLELLAAVREDSSDLPFVLFTDRGSEEVASEAISAGVTDYLRRGGPGDLRMLASRVETLVEQHRVERTRERFRRLVEEATDAIMVVTPEGEITYATPSSGRILGRTPEELVGTDAFSHVHPEDVERVAERYDRMSHAPGARDSVEFRYYRPDGTEIWLEARGRNLIDEPAVEGIVVYVREVTDRRERERKLERLQECTRELMHTGTSAETGRVAVEAARDVLGVELAGLHLRDGDTLAPVAVLDAVRDELGEAPAYDRTDGPADAVVWEAFERGEPVVVDDAREHRPGDAPDGDGAGGSTAGDDARAALGEATSARSGVVHPLGDHGVFIVSSTDPGAFDDADRALIEILATSLRAALDRVERETLLREREAQLERENERLDRFASVVSHELKNPLTVVDGSIKLARETGDDEHFRRAIDGVDRMRTLVDDLLTLAREGRTVDEVVPVDLATAVEDAWVAVEADGARLEVAVDRTIRADPDRLRLLLENLFRNSVEHAGSDVTITVGALDAGFYVADDGPGIPPDEREQVFEAGYAHGEGTGFGLSIVREVAEAHGWSVAATESAGGGARFEVTGVEPVD